MSRKKTLFVLVFVALIIIGLVAGSLLYAVTVEARDLPPGWQKHPDKCHGSFRSLDRRGLLWKVPRECW